MANREAKIRNRSRHKTRYWVGLPQQPEGQPRGKHLQGFKGTKVDGICRCGGCNPKIKEGVV